MCRSFINTSFYSEVCQIPLVVPSNKWGDIYVGSSGSFRVYRAIRERDSSVRFHSNDVSLVTCGLGALRERQEGDEDEEAPRASGG